jgi:hypothetical protein
MDQYSSFAGPTSEAYGLTSAGLADDRRSLKRRGDRVYKKITEDLAALVTSNKAKGTDSCKQVGLSV